MLLPASANPTTLARLRVANWIAGPLKEALTDITTRGASQRSRTAFASAIAIADRRHHPVLPKFPALRWLVRDHRGSIAVEFAILVPIQALLIFGGLDSGFAMLTAQRLNFATEAAARCGAVENSSCPTPDATSAWAAQQAGLPNITSGNFIVTFNAGCGGVSVVATYRYTGLVLPAIDLRAAACYATEKAS